MRPGKIAFYLPDLSGGGAERLVLNLAADFVRRGIAVDLVLDHAAGALIGAVADGVRLIDLGSGRAMQSLPRLARYLKEARPEMLIANLGHNNIVALWAKALAFLTGGGRHKVVVVQHNMLSAEARRGGKYKILPLLYRLFLPLANGVVGVSQGIADDLAALAHAGSGRVTVIYNGVVTDDFDARAAVPVAHPWLQGEGPPVFVAVGRLVEQKDFATLIQAFAVVAARQPARLIILGEGPLRADLIALTQRVGVAAAVDLPGYVVNPLPFMRRAAAVVLSSRYEGFALVLAEALACGTPVVSTDCPHGPAEILAQGRYGRLVPVGDATALAQAMIAVLGDPAQPDILRRRGRVFSVKDCAEHYLRLFEKL